MGQPEDDLGQEKNQHDEQDLGDHEGHDADVDRAQGDFRHHALDDEHVHADGRRDQAELDHHHHQNAEPDRIEVQTLDDGEKDRNGQQDHGQGVEHAAHDHVDQQDDRHDHHRRVGQVVDEVRQGVGDAGKHQQVVQRQGADQDNKNHRRRADGLHQRVLDRPPAQPPPQGRDNESADGADAGGLGRREDAEVNAADDQQEQQQYTPSASQGLKLDGRCGLLAGLADVRPDPGDDGNGDHKADNGQDAGQETGDKEITDAGFGQNAVEHQDDAGRDQDADNAAGGDRAGGQAFGVVVTLHLGQGDFGHGRRGCQGGAADRSKSPAGADGGQRQTTPEGADPGVKRLVKFLA